MHEKLRPWTAERASGAGGSGGTAAVARGLAGRGAAAVPQLAQNLSLTRISSPQFVQNIAFCITLLD